MCQGIGGAGQLDGGGPVSTLLFFRLENSVIKRKEKKSHKVSSYETKRREGDKQFPVASTFQYISVDFGLKPSFQPSRQAEVNLSGVIFIRTHHMRWPAVPAGPSRLWLALTHCAKRALIPKMIFFFRWYWVGTDFDSQFQSRIIKLLHIENRWYENHSLPLFSPSSFHRAARLQKGLINCQTLFYHQEGGKKKKI